VVQVVAGSIGGAGFSFRMHRHRRGDAPGAGKLPARLRGSIIIGPLPRGRRSARAPCRPVTGRVWKGIAFGGARGQADVPRIVDWYREGEIDIDDLITPTLSPDDSDRGFALVAKGEGIRSTVLH
jgi:Zn-dependent alcohol dehydrogenase